MKIVQYKQDVKYQLNIKDSANKTIQVNACPYYAVYVYTNDSRCYIDITSYINNSNLIQFDSELIGPLSAGQINFKVMMSETNPAFSDGLYNTVKLIHSDLYFDLNSEISDIQTAQWGQITGSISRQTDLVDYIKSKTDDKVQKSSLDSSVASYLNMNNYYKVIRLSEQEY